MACTGSPITDPSIDCLDFLLLWDISGATPTLTITNNSSAATEGAVATWQISSAGSSGYAVGDIVALSGGAGIAPTFRVATINSFPLVGVATVTLVNPGSGVVPGVIYNTTGGTGTGLTIKVLTTTVAWANLNWWFYITTPSGVVIHGEDLSGVVSLPTPDVSAEIWSPVTYDIPLIFGTPPCGQIEFSPNVPYNVTVYVQDITLSPPPLYALLKTTIIVRPNGNTQAGSNLPNSCGNFGSANISMNVVCASSQIQCSDITNLIYNNLPPQSTPTNTWTLVSPPPPSGDTPVITVVTNEANVTFTGTVDSDGYQLYFNEFTTYNLGNGITINVQYKLFDCNGNTGIRFSYNCNTSLCNLMCNLEKLYQLANVPCGTLESQNITNQITLLTPLLFQLSFALTQPLCGVNIPALIKQINKVGKFPDNCGCNGTNNSINV